MNVKTLPLRAAGIVTIGKGRFFRVLKASYPLTITTYAADGDSQTSQVLANTGAEFKQFARAEITSDYDQTVIVAYSDLPIFDNRLGVDDNTLLKVDGNRNAIGLAALVASGANEVLTVAANPDRKSLTIQAGANAGLIWAGSESVNVGLPISANDTLTVEVKEEFKLFATNANDRVYLLEVI